MYFPRILLAESSGQVFYIRKLMPDSFFIGSIIFLLRVIQELSGRYIDTQHIGYAESSKVYTLRVFPIASRDCIALKTPPSPDNKTTSSPDSRSWRCRRWWGIAQDIGRIHAWVFNPKQGKTQPINVTPKEKQTEFQIKLIVSFCTNYIFSEMK